jgi:glycosyltransferase involved in cell wall biosynthesis
VPAIVNAVCSATVEHCSDSGGGLWFGSYAEFEVVLDVMMADAALRTRLGERGRRYVQANFRWPVIIDRYDRFASRVLDRVTHAGR